MCSDQDRKSLDGAPIIALDCTVRDGSGPARKAIWSGFNVENVLTMLKEASKDFAARFSPSTNHQPWHGLDTKRINFIVTRKAADWRQILHS